MFRFAESGLIGMRNKNNKDYLSGILFGEAVLSLAAAGAFALAQQNVWQWGMLAAAACFLIAAFLRRRHSSAKEIPCCRVQIIPRTQKQKNASPVPGIQLGSIHNQGKREYQQDSLGCIGCYDSKAVLAVVADGMGGLENSEQVSQALVMKLMAQAEKMPPREGKSVLLPILQEVNESINQMLGEENLYKSGTTVTAVLADRSQFQWISVGDSRIYLFRDGCLLQLNEEHNGLMELMPDVLAGRMTYDEAVQHPQSRMLSSFIGMGELRYISYSRDDLDLQSGDRILMMSDGVYGVLPDDEMVRILQENVNVQAAAEKMEERILELQIPEQDNFTVVILGV